MITPANLLGPACQCERDPCVCFVGGISWQHKRLPVKTPLFKEPPPPDGYRVRRRVLTKQVGEVDHWVHVLSYLDNSNVRYSNWGSYHVSRRVKVKALYRRKIDAEKVCQKMREVSDHKEVRVEPYWYRSCDRPNAPLTVAEILEAAGKYRILPNGKVVSQDGTPLPGVTPAEAVAHKATQIPIAHVVHDEWTVISDAKPKNFLDAKNFLDSSLNSALKNLVEDTVKQVTNDVVGAGVGAKWDKPTEIKS
jgi:hypothetical protein